jgi:hypothetical protein
MAPSELPRAHPSRDPGLRLTGKASDGIIQAFARPAPQACWPSLKHPMVVRLRQFGLLTRLRRNGSPVKHRRKALSLAQVQWDRRTPDFCVVTGTVA